MNVQNLDERKRLWDTFDGLSLKDKRQIIIDLVQSNEFTKLDENEHLEIFWALSRAMTIPPQWHPIFYPSARIFSFDEERKRRILANS